MNEIKINNLKQKIHNKVLRLTLVVIIISNIFLIPTNRCVLSFTDLRTSHWAYKNIMKLATTNVINGYTDGTFKPEGTITYGEFIKLVVMAGLPEWIDINDAEENFKHWAAKYVWIAERYGVIKTGSIGLNNIDNPINRLDMVRIITKADLTMKGNNLETAKKVTFNDAISLNNEDLLLLKHAVSKNFITGYTDGSFKPYNNMTRAEAATMICRFK